MILRLAKMHHEPGPVLQYFLGQHKLNDWIGRRLSLIHTGKINCVHCDREIQKTFGDGYCYPCFTSLARCDACIIKPEKCHFHEGTCREPQWGQNYCLVPHVVYVAQTSGVKVGVTGAHKTHERWGDQGAVRARVLAITPERKIAGELEHLLAQHMSDRTAWQKLITGRLDPLDFHERFEQALRVVPGRFRHLLAEDGPTEELNYPVERYCQKAKTINLTKQPEISGELHGVKGQYLFMDSKAFNVRRHAGYQVDVQAL